MTTYSIVDEIAEKIGNKSFCTANDVIELGLFGSHTAVHIAFRRGDLPFVKISARRFVIPTKDLLKFIERNFSVKQNGGVCSTK